jgi:predicted permease
MLDAILRDVRYATRGLLRSPGFTAVAVLSLGLGLGVNTALFTVVNAVLLRPLPVERPDRLVAIFTTGDNGGAYSSSSYPDFLDLAARNATLDGIAAHSLMMVGIDRPSEAATRLAVGEIVSPNYFSVLGVRLAIGAGFAPDAARTTAAPSTVLSYRMWQRDFHGGAGALGKIIVIRGTPYTIVGVAPNGFDGLASGVSAELWLPAGRVDDVEPFGEIDTVASASGNTRVEKRGQRWLFLTGRLKDTATVEQARANLNALMATLETENPISNTHRRATVLPGSSVRIHPDVDGALAPASILLMAAVELVLLVACSNLASMLLARATSRAREMAVRLAIGASRWQLMRQLIVESLLLSAAGGLVSLLLAQWAGSALIAVQLPIPFSVVFNLSPDVRVLLFTFGVTAVTGVLVGLAPALQASRPNLVPALKGEAELTRTRRFGLRNLLVAGQMAMSMLLLVVAGLLLRSFVAASHVAVGFDADKVVYAAINGSKQFPDATRTQQFYAEAERRLKDLPGVTSVARVNRLPFSLNINSDVIEIDGVRGPAPSGGVPIDVTAVSATYFTTMGVPIVRGRAFDSRDREDTELVAIVNEAAARQYWPGREAIGQHFKRGGKTFTIVGITGNHIVRSAGEHPRPYVQYAIDQDPPSFQNLVARTDGSTSSLVAPVRQTLLGIEPRLAFMGLEPLTALEDASLFPARAGMVLLGVFGSLALLLAAIGLYGVMAFNVSRRTREIGIRMALGAGAGLVHRQMVIEGLKLVAIGGAAGLVLAVVASRALGSMLIGIGALDPISFLGATAVLITTAFCATLIPARRAARTDPMVALRRG